MGASFQQESGGRWAEQVGGVGEGEVGYWGGQWNEGAGRRGLKPTQGGEVEGRPAGRGDLADR